MPLGARGTPELLPDRCRGHAACAAVCPTDAISVLPADPNAASAVPAPTLDAARIWQIDYGRCVFCGLCAEVCPEQAITVTGRYELAARRREDLVVRVPLGGAAQEEVSTETATTGGAGQTDAILAARLRRVIHRAFRRSLHVRHLDAGSDNAADWELTTLLGPVYDVQRLGIDFVASPRHADVLAITGPVTRGLETAVRRTYEATPDPMMVIAIGTAACGGDVVEGSYAVSGRRGGADSVIPVDVYVPGDPPRPQAIIHGLLLAVDRARPTRPGQ
jgi:Ni,Fe-hydrogenase III small subunit/formate hydrogenlyase subunit 6/NADH:ubiquinone oxidoreductase subunit I